MNICNDCKSLVYAPREKCNYCDSSDIDEVEDEDREKVMCPGWDCNYKTFEDLDVFECPECGAELVDDNESDEPQFDDGWY